MLMINEWRRVVSKVFSFITELTLFFEIILVSRKVLWFLHHFKSVKLPIFLLLHYPHLAEPAFTNHLDEVEVAHGSC